MQSFYRFIHDVQVMYILVTNKIQCHDRMNTRFTQDGKTSVTKKMDPPEIVPPGPTTLKYLDPPVQILRSSAEVIGPPLK